MHRILTRVVLPAPLRPSRPNSSPLRISRFKWLTAVTVLLFRRVKNEVRCSGLLIFEV